MACIEPGGALSPSGRAMLESLATPLKAEEIAQRASQPLFKVRASMRELTEAGLVTLQDDAYVITDAGKDAIKN
ncbi:MAG: hypothetical protein KFF77_00830 [Bacteroidetes bacterium]|nr:hypothetical protein [Bacteroidota bacterium]